MKHWIWFAALVAIGCGDQPLAPAPLDRPAPAPDGCYTIAVLLPDNPRLPREPTAYKLVCPGDPEYVQP